VSDDFDRRGGWSKQLSFLLERHPRATWPARHSTTVEFWLGVHERLRRDCAGLEAAGDEQAGAPARLAIIAAPRLHGLVAAMQGHHQIEDFQYFPAFRRAEPRLTRGFDLLERDHADLRGAVDTALAALAQLRSAAERSAAPATLGFAAERYAAAAAALCSGLLQHLRDEEHLVVPLLIERGDAGMDADGSATQGAVADY
jgi:hypothetical protein